jgi:deoxyribodipyrimidine photo-lyase
MRPPAILWFRQDLRLQDNPALRYAVEQGLAVIPIYIWSPEEEANWPAGGASKWWLHQSLTSLQEDLQKRSNHLIIRQGSSKQELLRLAGETGAQLVLWNRRYEPAAHKRDQSVTADLGKLGLTVKSFNSALLCEPQRILNKEGRPFRVFTSYWRACLAAHEPSEPLPAPKRLPGFEPRPDSITLAELGLEPKIDWAGGIKSAWHPGQSGAQRNCENLLRNVLDQYQTSRNYPGQEGVSRLSPHLHFGEISPQYIWHEVKKHAATADSAAASESAQVYLKELGWREFAYYLLYHFPDTPEKPLYEQFANFPFRRDNQALKAWHKGLTGYPLVDAGMRELWSSGWMHNRVRMIVASFLVKDLLLPWQAGAKWFWDTLVDADLASNTMGWQWVAGCGADAAPYFRIFNPTLQSEKFDPDGNYIRQWVPELSRLAAKNIHNPATASEKELAEAGVILGKTYPSPIVDHAIARHRALDALKKVKESGKIGM